MNLHNDQEAFDNLAEITAQYIGIPTSAIKRDYLIVMLLQNLEQSEYADSGVFRAIRAKKGHGLQASGRMKSWNTPFREETVNHVREDCTAKHSIFARKFRMC